jgi:triosephosphate isomerase
MESRFDPIVIGNWKMNGTRAEIADLVFDLCSGPLPAIDLVLCPPAIYCETVRNALQQNASETRFALGAQNAYCESSGAFTGEISPNMLLDMGCRYVILGHSERRQLFFEDDTLIARKSLAAYHVGLIPIICVGETARERADGKTVEVVCRQLRAILEELPITALAESIIAYEPVWAIGTGVTAKPEEAEAVHATLRHWLAERDAAVAKKVRIVYGGSVKSANADQLLCMPNIDGALVGGASLDSAEFLKICDSAFRCAKN